MQAVAAATSGEYGRRELTIRCNALSTPWGADDLAAAGAARPSAVVIPKIAGTAELDAVAAALNSRPRKTLGYKAPAEALNEHLLSL